MKKELYDKFVEPALRYSDDKFQGAKAGMVIYDDMMDAHRYADIVNQLIDTQMKQMAVQVAPGSFDACGNYVADTDKLVVNGVDKWIVDDYSKDEDAARAWRELWKKILKYNKSLKASDKKPGASPLLRALAEVERLQALDRTLERRLKGD